MDNKLMWVDNKRDSHDITNTFTVECQPVVEGERRVRPWRLINSNPITSEHFVICGDLSILIGKFKTRKAAKYVAELIAKG